MKGRIKLLRRALATGLLVTVGAVLTATAAQAQASPLNLAYWGNAYGSTVTAGTVVSSGPTFQAVPAPGQATTAPAQPGCRSASGGGPVFTPGTPAAPGTANNSATLVAWWKPS